MVRIWNLESLGFGWLGLGVGGWGRLGFSGLSR